MTDEVYPLILAIDPGGTTGISIRGNTPERKLSVTTVSSLEGLIVMLDTIHKGVLDAVVIEDFITNHMISRDGLDTVQKVGATRAWCFINKVRLSVQTPQFRYSSREQMEKELAGRRTIIHERDATLHLLAFEEKIAPEWRRLYNWPTRNT